MIKVGVTGGIGSGKTALCKAWKEMGAEIVDSDKLAKQVMEENPDLVQRIKNEFGQQAYLPDGSLNREYLSVKSFREGKINVLNELVHPVVREKVKKLMDEADRNGVSVFVQEAALLLDQGRPDIFDYVILVTSPEKERIQRVQNRDRVTVSDVQSRIDKQVDYSRLKSLCDFVIENNSTLNEFRKKSINLFLQLIQASETT